MKNLISFCAALAVLSGWMVSGGTALASEYGAPKDIDIWSSDIDSFLPVPSLSQEDSESPAKAKAKSAKAEKKPAKDKEAPVTGPAADREGRVCAGAAFVFSNQSADDYSSTSLIFIPSAGYYLAPEHELGVDIVIESSGVEVGNDDATGTSIGFLAKYNYHFITSPQLSPYAGPHLGFQHVTDGDSETGFNLGLQAGVHYFASSKIALKAEWRLSLISIDPDDVVENLLLVGFDVFLDR